MATLILGHCLFKVLTIIKSHRHTSCCKISLKNKNVNIFDISMSGWSSSVPSSTWTSTTELSETLLQVLTTYALWSLFVLFKLRERLFFTLWVVNHSGGGQPVEEVNWRCDWPLVNSGWQSHSSRQVVAGCSLVPSGGSRSSRSSSCRESSTVWISE